MFRILLVLLHLFLGPFQGHPFLLNQVVDDVKVVDDIAYIADWDTLQIVDVSNASDPITIGVVDMPGNALGLDVIGDIAFVASGDAGIQMVDVLKS